MDDFSKRIHYKNNTNFEGLEPFIIPEITYNQLYEALKKLGIIW